MNMSDEKFMRNHWNSEAERYISTRKWSRTDQRILNFITEIKPQNLLEIGFGPCVLAEKMREVKPEISYFGLDLSENFIEEAKKVLGDWGKLILASASTPPFRMHSFDCILEMTAIHHFPKAKIINTKEDVLAKGRIRRRTLLKTDMKYPNILVDEEITVNADGEEVVESHKAMVADHIIVSLSDSINEKDLYEVMVGGHLGGAAIDVFENEPYQGNLTEIDRCLLTAHMGSMSVDCRSQMELEATKEVVRFFSGEPLKSEVPQLEYSNQD